jgi:hypothetical protein
MSNLQWSTIVGAAPGTKETSAEAKLLADALRNVQSHMRTSPHAANALHAYLELQWLSLAHQEQSQPRNEDHASRNKRIQDSVSERRAIQRLTAELFTDLSQTTDMATSKAQETALKNQH